MSIIDRLTRLLGASASARDPEASAPPSVLQPVDVDYEDVRVPDTARAHVRRILACLLEVEAAMTREQVPGFSRIDLEQMRDHHLPKLIKSYIDIPSAHRSEIFRKTGKSASFILNESLDKMQARVDEIMKNLAQHDIDAFTNNIQFIGQRYKDDHDPFC